MDVLVAEPPISGGPTGSAGFHGRDAFVLDAQHRSVVCLAGRSMHGPFYDKAHAYHRYTGVGCKDCPLKPQCTPGRERNLTVDWDYEQSRDAMCACLARSGARERYNRRIATVEPVFSSLEDAMDFRRVSSRLPQTVRAEILRNLLAHNVGRLVTRGRLFCAFFRFPLSAPPSGLFFYSKPVLVDPVNLSAPVGVEEARVGPVAALVGVGAEGIALPWPRTFPHHLRSK